MRNTLRIRYTFTGLVLFALCFSRAYAQQILLDEPNSAGELHLYPDVTDPNKYYYLSDKPRLALHTDGSPQFTFMNYVKNTDDGTEGGGIVTAVVELSVSDAQLQEARQELRRKNPNGEIVGPVMWKSGTIALVSSLVNPDGKLTEQVVGLGMAPILDGHRAAVSVQLTAKGAEILWKNFQLPTPDLSISFEMELQGFRKPKNAVIEANFDQIYEYKAFSAGVATPYLAADINTAFEDLRKNNAIKVTTLDADEKMEAMITTAYNKLTEMMFEPLGGTGTPNLQQLTSMGNQGESMLDRASKMLAASRQEARQDNQRIRQENQAERNRAQAENQRIQQKNQETQPSTDQSSQPGEENNQENPVVADGGRPLPRSQQPPIRPGKAQQMVKPTDQPGLVVLDDVQPNLQEEVSVPSLAIAASFQMKKIRHQGTYRIDLNKSSSEIVTVPFDANFGEFIAGCASCLQRVNLDDPLYHQREILAFVDGMNADDFGKFINFVTVSMTKKHESGETTYDEIRIDRNNFNAEGNNFKMIYGWKGDDNRDHWLNYSIKTNWSFFGGHNLETEVLSSEASAINLAPPFQRKIISLEADPVLLQDAGVRLVNVKVFYVLGGKEFSQQLTLNTRKEPVAGTIEFMLPKGQTSYDYEIEWRLTGNQMVTSGRQTTSFDFLMMDELPLSN